MKPALLYLVHRIPFPPNKGDKIRSYHVLKFLSQHYRVFLGTFIDDPDDWQYTEAVRAMCEDCCLVALDPVRAKIKSASGLLSGEALTLPYYFNQPLADWVGRVTTEHAIERAFVFSSAMAQYVVGQNYRSKVIDFVDIDSDKWRQYAAHKTWPLSWVYRREAGKLLAYEKQIASEFNASLFVSSAEAALFKTMAPESESKISHFYNGVDTVYFSPDVQVESPFGSDQQALVFTGAMDYWPNVDAVTWFAQNIFPQLQAHFSKLKFYIVGSKPSDEVKALEQMAGIHVTGRVADVRPYLKYAAAVVTPMRVARGIQNKVLEAMAMAQVVVTSPQGLEGINAEHGQSVLLAEDIEQWVDLTKRAISGEFSEMGHIAREKVMKDFSWEDNLPAIKDWLEAATTN